MKKVVLPLAIAVMGLMIGFCLWFNLVAKASTHVGAGDGLSHSEHASLFGGCCDDGSKFNSCCIRPMKVEQVSYDPNTNQPRGGASQDGGIISFESSEESTVPGACCAKGDGNCCVLPRHVGGEHDLGTVHPAAKPGFYPYGGLVLGDVALSASGVRDPAGAIQIHCEDGQWSPRPWEIDDGPIGSDNAMTNCPHIYEGKEEKVLFFPMSVPGNQDVEISQCGYFRLTPSERAEREKRVASERAEREKQGQIDEARRAIEDLKQWTETVL